jgi:hypothetical protein
MCSTDISEENIKRKFRRKSIVLLLPASLNGAKMFFLILLCSASSGLCKLNLLTSLFFVFFQATIVVAFIGKSEKNWKYTTVKQQLFHVCFYRCENGPKRSFLATHCAVSFSMSVAYPRAIDALFTQTEQSRRE